MFGSSAQAIANVRSYAEADAFLAEKGVDSRKICGNNTYVERRGEDIAVRYHQTDIITFLKAAAPLIVLDTGGWHTQSTKQRLSQFLPAGVTVFSFKGQWRVGNGQHWAQTKADLVGSVIFTDGLRLIHNTVGWEPLNALTAEDEAKIDAAKRSLDKAVKAYVKKLGEALPKWTAELRETQSLNVAGDPWCCTMRMDSSTDHLWQHLKDDYVFPTIIVRAFEDSGRYTAASTDRGGNAMSPADWAVRALGFGWDRHILKEVATYLRKHLDPVKAITAPRTPDAPALPNSTLERFTEHAKDVLQEPDSYAYFGKDETLYKSSAPTFGRNRDSENLDIANFEIVWEALVEEFPDLVTTTEGVDSKEVTNEKPGGIYVHGASHWACGWVEQIVVPVLKDPARPVGPSNLHPAFIKVCEFAEQVKLYPALPGAEERAAEKDHADYLANIKEWQEYIFTRDHDPYIAAFSAEHLAQFVDDDYDWGTEAVVELHRRACWEDSLVQINGQGVLL